MILLCTSTVVGVRVRTILLLSRSSGLTQRVAAATRTRPNDKAQKQTHPRRLLQHFVLWLRTAYRAHVCHLPTRECDGRPGGVWGGRYAENIRFNGGEPREDLWPVPRRIRTIGYTAYRVRKGTLKAVSRAMQSRGFWRGWQGWRGEQMKRWRASPKGRPPKDRSGNVGTIEDFCFPHRNFLRQKQQPHRAHTVHMRRPPQHTHLSWIEVKVQALDRQDQGSS